MGMTKQRLEEILRRARSELAAALGAELDTVLLYGSQARGDARPDSDIDLLIVLRGPFDAADIRRRTAHIASRLSLEYDTVVSRAFATRDQLEHEMSPFMLNVRDEAVPV
jgi:uncharacterized protein